MSADPKLIIVSGKGGVGKSAVAAARSMAAARTGRRVLALSATTSPGLGYHLATPKLSFQPVEIEPGLFAASINLGEALQEYLRFQLNVPTPRFGIVARAFEVLANTAPGIREIITIGKAIHDSESGNWDVVILDAPPTGQIASFIRAPRTVGELAPTGRVLQQSAWMESILAAETTQVVLVTLLEELPVSETNETITELADLGLTPPPIVVANRVLEPLAIGANVVAGISDGPHRWAAELHMALQKGQAQWAGRIKADSTLPHLFGILTPAEVAARLLEELR